MGYDTLYSVKNFGSLFVVAFMLCPLIAVIGYLLKFVKRPFAAKIHTKKMSWFRWAFVISILFDGFLLLTFCWMMNTRNMKFDQFGNTFNSVVAIFFALISIGFFVFSLAFFLNKKVLKKMLEGR